MKRIVTRAKKVKQQSKMSLAERRWKAGGYEHLLESQWVDGAKMTMMLYEWYSFRLPGGLYTPDFNLFLDDGRLMHIEIKESAFARNFRDSRSKLRAAASLNPWFDFFMARLDRKAGIWRIEYIEPDGKGWFEISGSPYNITEE